jgi:hypothetical protein
MRMLLERARYDENGIGPANQSIDTGTQSVV